MMPGPQKTVVLDVVGLSRNLISQEHTPFLHSYLSGVDVVDRDVEPVFPALTCPAQSTYFTGVGPATHGVTANVSHDVQLRVVVQVEGGAVRSVREHMITPATLEMFPHFWRLNARAFASPLAPPRLYTSLVTQKFKNLN